MKICIENKDRHGLVYDISKILLKYNIKHPFYGSYQKHYIFRNRSLIL